MFCIQNASFGPALPLVNGVEQVEPSALVIVTSIPNKMAKAKPTLCEWTCIMTEPKKTRAEVDRRRSTRS